ncbi:MAG: SDR family oxidoreductase [Myxococcota bacterium]
MVRPVDIDGKVAFVTGANRGIGKELVRGLIAAGASKVYGAVRNPDSLAPLVTEFGEGLLAPVQFDLADEQSAIGAARFASDTEVLISNAGVMGAGSVLDDDFLQTLQWEIDTNLFGPVRLVRAFAPVLERNGGGAFVQINSTASLKCFDPGFTSYCASKAAAYSVTQALRMQLAQTGTAVFSVHPGPIATDMADASGFGSVAQPPSLVVEAILDAFNSGTFHVWPDPMSKQVGDAYRAFGKSVIEADWAFE